MLAVVDFTTLLTKDRRHHGMVSYIMPPSLVVQRLAAKNWQALLADSLQSEYIALFERVRLSHPLIQTPQLDLAAFEAYMEELVREFDDHMTYVVAHCLLRADEEILDNCYALQWLTNTAALMQFEYPDPSVRERFQNAMQNPRA